MDWPNETVLRFLELYQMCSCIWNPKDESHKNRDSVNDAWIFIKDNMEGPCTVQELKKKKDSLMSAYRAYKCRVKKSETGPGDVYQPTWFAFALMDSFLGNVYNCNRPIKIENENTEQNNTDSNSNEDNGSDDDDKPLCANTSATSSKQSHSLVTSQESSHLRTALALKRRILQAKQQMNQAFDILINVTSSKQLNEEEDECHLFGKLLAKKLRKLPEGQRDLMMLKINELIYNESQNCD